MITVPRNDNSVVGRWWWTVDRWSLGAVLLIMGVGVMLTMAASPPAAERIGADSFHFVRRQLLFLPVALAVMLAISLAPPRMVRRLSLVVFAVGLAALAATLVVGTEIKGARRWISLPGFGTVQPSEFVKPSLAVISAWLFAQKKLNPRFPGFLLSTVLFAAVLGMLLMQPDLGMSVVVTVVWAAQFFLAGLPIWLAVMGTGLAAAGLVGAFLTFSHVQARIERFINPDAGENYQVNTALEAFMNGGLFGRGPGEGTVKAQLPDAHTDFVMAVAGEEFGLIVCLIVLLLFAFITLRSMSRIANETSLFIMLAAAGLVIQFGLQAFINMASTVQLMPAKGMTLPFISYGGSSAVAMALAVGMMLALTRERAGLGEAS
ncbi:cell division protein FtsW [Vineibacter terrae]|uniref:Probable peptidoglycan glycosyltransferase FtsW n=1 Tax=Vineibacter terrae TaxID=2586908 RepID=A0A5C8PIC4_9HYPH|nr:putative peptidoglycan glycosyltransferase FtsW [Vineibacter terrae]TXL73558.1 cell division protein FtsW [Vineibacter terrae]